MNDIWHGIIFSKYTLLQKSKVAKGHTIKGFAPVEIQPFDRLNASSESRATFYAYLSNI